ncbi:TraB domain-containing protein [Trichinella papuae]|uniref:TraB domain-containing protein n=1 Tax=Trichinella papuae TaxID=268474 RepID=A0A0V1MMW0_9BILA|nr:TraB domain-containing protein [Trichinella papuae]
MLEMRNEIERNLRAHVADDDEVLPKTVSKLSCSYTSGEGEDEVSVEGNIYLVGTAHFSKASQCDVIRKVHPHAVMVELCEKRDFLLHFEEEVLLRELQAPDSFKNIKKLFKENGVVFALMMILFKAISGSMARQLGTFPGSEFRVAFQEAAKVDNCLFYLGDRDISITFHRAIAMLNIYQKMKLLICMVKSVNADIKSEVMEEFKDTDVLDKVILDITEYFPLLAEVLIKERDQYLAHQLRSAFADCWLIQKEQEKDEPIKIVGVVGIAHVKGIIATFNNNINIKELKRIPKPKRDWIKIVLKFVLYGLVSYGTYRFMRRYLW